MHFIHSSLSSSVLADILGDKNSNISHGLKRTTESLRGFSQCFGSGIRIRIQSGQWIRIRNLDPREQKWPTKIGFFFTNFIFWSAGCSLLRAEGFFCSLDGLYGGLGIGECNCWSVFSLKCWIRIRIKWIRIRNTGFSVRQLPVLTSVYVGTVRNSSVYAIT